MKKITLFSIVFLSIVGTANAQKSKLLGSWLMIKVEVNGETEYPYQVTEFTKDGKMLMMGREFATWSYNKKKHAIVMKSDFEKEFNGEGKVLKLTKKEFVLEKDGMKAFYKRFDKAKIYEDNTASGLIGTWRLTNETDPDVVQILVIKSAEEFLFVEKRFNTQSKREGEWIFNKNEKNVIFVGYLEHLKGLNKILTLSSDELSLENKGKIYSFKKEENQDVKIERLTFIDKDFYDETGDYKYYDDEQKLPWQDPYQMMDELSKVKQLVYKYSILIGGTESFETKTLTADVKASLNEETLNIDNIFDGYDRYNLPDDYQLPSNKWDQFSSKLYPYKDATFRVIGTEEVTVPAGTFTCVVVELLGSFDEKVKLWLVTNKPGIIAKVIKDNPESFGSYRICELQEIKTF